MKVDVKEIEAERHGNSIVYRFHVFHDGEQVMHAEAVPPEPMTLSIQVQDGRDPQLALEALVERYVATLNAEKPDPNRKKLEATRTLRKTKKRNVPRGTLNA